MIEEGELKIGEVVRDTQPHILREYKIHTNGTYRKAENIITAPTKAYDERGTEIGGARVTRPLIDKQTLLGTTEFTNPRWKEWSAELKGEKRKTKQIVVKEMTNHMVQQNTERPTCERQDRWPTTFGVQSIEWEKLWDWFRQGLATPVDFGPRFKMIHGLLGTASKMGKPGGCRLGCGEAVENHIHIMRCPILKKMWWKPLEIIENCRGKRYKHREMTLVLGWDGEQVEKGTVALCSMLMKIILIEWYLVAKKQQNFDVDKVWRIFWVRAERKWREFARERAADLRNVRQRGSDHRSTLRGINGQLRPIGEMDEEGRVHGKIDWKKHREWKR